MKVSGGCREEGVVIGNTFDKYSSRNPLVGWIMRGFTDSLAYMVQKAAPQSIHEVGCGEGYWVCHWNKEKYKARGSDFSGQIISLARENAQKQGISSSVFSRRSIYDIEPGRDSADLLVCCEVLEHLEYPEKGLASLQRVAREYVIISVPREPLWCVLNLLRGKYISDFGNTPGHIQHWSTNRFIELVNKYFVIVEVKKPLPWTMLLCRVRK